ncbi:MAG: hypothetical protein PF448_00205 [Bacteroidales bacterium]|jgi:hypothetical protein|nr:hypothetical protein [Bacteroidales bacterium]
MKKIFTGLSFALIVFASFTAFSQTEDELEAMRQDFENYKQQESENFRKYVEEQDKAFADFLKKDWERFELFKGREPERVPGPEKIPRYKPSMDVEQNTAIPVIDSRDDSTPEIVERKPIAIQKQPLIVELPIQEAVKPGVKRKTAMLNYYGKEMQFLYDPDLHQNPGTDNGPNVISAYFETLSETDYFKLIEQLFQVQRQLRLNDWGYLLLIEDMSEQICVTEKEKVLFQWFILLKSGYKTKLAYYDDALSLLIPSQTALYGVSYLKIDGQQYYVLNKDLQHIHTYNKDYPGAERIFDVQLDETPNLPLSLSFRNFKINDDAVKIAFNENLRSFYQDFPQSEIRVFFHSAMSPITRESLMTYFEKAIEGKAEQEAVNIILRFVQTQFDYKTDDEQFGYEKFFFPDELFMYPAADCEDRSVLFAYLVEELTGLQVVGLDYPGHIATAVKFNDMVKGRYVEYRGERFTVCDPTFIGAPVGASMPQYENAQAVIIPLDSRMSIDEISEPLWSEIYENGGFRNNVEQIAVQDASGNIYLCGSFNKKMQIAGKQLTSHKPRSGFVASFTPDNQLRYLIKIDKEEYVTPEHLMVSENQLLVSGKIEEENSSSHFISSYDMKQNENWFVRIDAEQQEAIRSGYIGYYLNEAGELIEKKNVNDMSVDESSVLAVLPDGLIRLNAYNPAPVYHSEARNLTSMEMAKLWKKTSEEYERLAYHKSVSGILAFFNTLEEYRFNVCGKEITATLNALNPNFMMQNASLHESLKQIEHISLNRGVLTINLKNNSRISLGNVYLYDGAKLRIHNYQTGNLKLSVINGIEFKSIFRSFDVNYIKLF